ncbi:sugar phosphate isomerase/epimerase [Fulvivirga ulvae]|uniref:sugar phosphate isomerase/epimerase family protein n=1 Tax=Fulvivirga ulvae TaxID=2904245 RepID=UPI001F189D84|nr:sugar phosphate isomerase/epimerase [Fulvivirga ulvae]UII30807.1 sugar phosphate isomerase/epimerase [Fulvivirga ulvae]
MKNHTRRSFIKYSALAGVGLMVIPSCLSQAAPATGIQLYTLRDRMAEDPAATLGRIAAMGYKEVESAGYGERQYYGLSAKEFRKLLDDNGLKAVSGHYLSGKQAPEKQGSLTNGWEQAVEDALEVGQKFMVCAYLFDFERETLDAYKETAALLNKCGEIAKENGIQLCYHNHAFEFETLQGEVPYDILLSETDKELIKMELDLYWTRKAGVDPIQLFKENEGRFPLFHVKDMNEAGEFTAVGTGVIDFDQIFANRDKAGLKHFFVEQDRIEGDPFENVKTSYNNLQEIIA